MLLNGSKLIGAPVASLHIGGEVAKTEIAVVNPNDLKVIAYQVNGPEIRGDIGNILRTIDVREYDRFGLVIDSTDELVNREDVAKINEIMGLNFSLIGMKVITKKGSKLGKVIDYIVDIDSFTIVQLVVKRPTIKSLLDPELIISRDEIVEIDDYKVIVKDEEKKIVEKAKTEEFVPNFTNPFRQNPEPQFSQSNNQNLDEQDNL